MTTKEEKKRAINRLKTMYPLRAKVDESYHKSIEATRAGKPAVWSMLNWWEGDVILKAMDLEVVYPENYGAVCAAQGVAGLHPYDWTGRVRRAWWGNPLFSCISTNLSKSFGERYPRAE